MKVDVLIQFLDTEEICERTISIVENLDETDQNDDEIFFYLESNEEIIGFTNQDFKILEIIE